MIRALIRDAAIVGICLVLLEGAMRAWAPRYGRSIYDHGLTGGYPIALNAEGMRGAALLSVRQPDEIRVLALGDSVTYGTGVAVTDAWPAQLGAEATSLRGAPVHVLNTGAPATDLRQITKWLRESGVGSQADAAAIVLTGNMVSLSWIRSDQAASLPLRPRARASVPLSATGKARVTIKRALLGLHSRVLFESLMDRGLYRIGLHDHAVSPAEPYGVLLAHGWRQLTLDPSIAEEAWVRFEADLADLKAAADDQSVALVASYSLPSFALGGSVVRNPKAVPLLRLSIDPEDRAQRACQRVGIPFVAASHVLRSQPRDDEVYLLMDYTHLSPRGHALLGRALARDLLAQLNERTQ
ncbi:MAG: hypothetical protein H7Y88_12220 [Phycisphaerales bacterium]|nr:hypothetical protein [Phycisphaerales bacterium]